MQPHGVWGTAARARSAVGAHARTLEGTQGGACPGWRPRPGLPEQVGEGKSVLCGPGVRRAGCRPRPRAWEEGLASLRLLSGTPSAGTRVVAELLGETGLWSSRALEIP